MDKQGVDRKLDFLPGKVSVIVPVYNVGEFLDSTIRSVRDQTHEQWELILVDDGSSDSSAEIARRHAAEEPRIRVHPRERGGVSVSRNFGLSVATGDWVIFFDGDDLWVPDTLRLLLEKQRQTGASAVYGAQQHMRQDGSTYRIGNSYPGGHILLASVTGGMVHIGATLINRKFLLDSGIEFTPKAARNEDMEFLWKLLALTPAEVVPETLQIRRYRTGSSTNESWSWEMALHSIGCYDRAAAFIEEKYLHSDKREVMEALAKKTAFWRFRALWNKLKQGDYPEVQAKLACPEWLHSLQLIERNSLTLPQRAQYWLLMNNAPVLWDNLRKSVLIR